MTQMRQKGQFTLWESEDAPGIEIQYSPFSGHYYLQQYHVDDEEIDYEHLLVEGCPERSDLEALRDFLTDVLESKLPTTDEILAAEEIKSPTPEDERRLLAVQISEHIKFISDGDQT